MLFIFLCFTLLLSSSHSANVLVIAGLRGSHLYVSTDVAEKLAEFGHNVTVLTMFSDKRVDMKDKAFHFITFGDENEAGALFKRWDTAFEHILHRMAAKTTLLPPYSVQSIGVLAALSLKFNFQFT